MISGYMYITLLYITFLNKVIKQCYTTSRVHVLVYCLKKGKLITYLFIESLKTTYVISQRDCTCMI